MEAFDAFLTEEGYKTVAKARKLHEEDSKNDPEDEPYKSKYAARELYQNVKNKIENFINEDANDETSLRIRLVKAAISLKLAVNYEETEELSTCQEILQNLISEMEPYKMKFECVNLYQAILNQLAILWTSRRNPAEALKHLQHSKQIYRMFKQQEGDHPNTWTECLEESNTDQEELLRNRVANFESTYTHTLYFCAQVYTQLEEPRKAAKYCHVTLQRQLASMKYDPIDWALNAASLSQYYLSENLSLSRHCMAAASYIFKEAPNDSDVGNDKDLFNQRQADISRCWIKYGLQLLDASKIYLSEEMDGLNIDFTAEDRVNVFKEKDEEFGEDDYDIDNISQKHLRYDLELTVYEEKITDKPVVIFDDARNVFLEVQNWIQSAKEYYILDDHCSDYIQLVQDHSTAFKYLAFFELDMDRQCKMHKKRADMLLEIANVINPQHYLLVKRQLIFELAETYSTMVDLKLAKIESDSNSRTPHAVNKINQLIRLSMEQFQAYLNSLKDPNTGVPSKFGENDVRPALIAKFCTGRLFTKLIVTGVEERLENMFKSLEHYKYVVDYCRRNESDKDRVQSEYDICVEMVDLLPLRMERIRQTSGL